MALPSGCQAPTSIDRSITFEVACLTPSQTITSASVLVLVERACADQVWIRQALSPVAVDGLGGHLTYKGESINEKVEWAPGGQVLDPSGNNWGAVVDRNLSRSSDTDIAWKITCYNGPSSKSFAYTKAQVTALAKPSSPTRTKTVPLLPTWGAFRGDPDPISLPGIPSTVAQFVGHSGNAKDDAYATFCYDAIYTAATEKGGGESLMQINQQFARWPNLRAILDREFPSYRGTTSQSAGRWLLATDAADNIPLDGYGQDCVGYIGNG